MSQSLYKSSVQTLPISFRVIQSASQRLLPTTHHPPPPPSTPPLTLPPSISLLSHSSHPLESLTTEPSYLRNPQSPILKPFKPPPPTPHLQTHISSIAEINRRTNHHTNIHPHPQPLRNPFISSTRTARTENQNTSTPIALPSSINYPSRLQPALLTSLLITPLRTTTIRHDHPRSRVLSTSRNKA